MEDKKLVITGMGAVTPIGIGTEAYWTNLLAGACGIVPISRFDTTDLPVRIAAEVRDLKAEESIPRTQIRNMGIFSQFAYVAGMEALNDANLATAPDADRIGIVMGSAMDGMSQVAETQAQISTGSAKKVSPRFVPMVLGNMAAGILAIDRGFHGPCMTLNTACSSGGDALMTAAMLLQAGEADAVLCVGAESILNPLFISSLAQAKALSRSNDTPQTACRPFDKNRDGFVIGEGGGAIVLETEEHARARGVAAYACLAGWANTQDGYHVTAPDPEGACAARCMQLALQRAGLNPEDIGYINAHGTATHVGDSTEAKAIQAVFAGLRPAVSSSKGATGHMMGAGGITEVITCIKALQTGLLPPTLNYTTPDPDCDLDIVAGAPRPCRIHAAMSNSLGFGGQNSSIVVTRTQDTVR